MGKNDKTLKAPGRGPLGRFLAILMVPGDMYEGPEGFLPKKLNFTMQVVQVLWYCPLILKFSIPIRSIYI